MTEAKPQDLTTEEAGNRRGWRGGFWRRSLSGVISQDKIYVRS